MVPLWSENLRDASVVRLTEANEVLDLIALFEEIATEQGWSAAGALREGIDRSTYFALRFETSDVDEFDGLNRPDEHPWIGGLQLVLPDEQGHLSCHDVWPEISTIAASKTGRPRSAHIAMLGIEDQHRGHSLHYWRLAVEMWRYCVGEGLTTLFIEVTPRVLPLYRRLGWPLHLQGSLRLHWGEECYLCTLEIPEVAQVLLQRAPDSPHYSQIVAQAFRLTPTVIATSGYLLAPQTDNHWA